MKTFKIFISPFVHCSFLKCLNEQKGTFLFAKKCVMFQSAYFEISLHVNVIDKLVAIFYTFVCYASTRGGP